MGIFIPPSSDSVNFKLGPVGSFPASSVPFELGEIQKAAADAGSGDGGINLRRVDVHEAPEGGQTAIIEHAYFPQKNFQRFEAGAGSETPRLSADFLVIETGEAIIVRQLNTTIPGGDDAKGILERAAIILATQIDADAGAGIDDIISYIKGYFEISSSDSGGGTGASTLQAQAAAKDRGLGQEIPPATEALLQALQEGLGKDRKLHVFVVRLGKPWGMVKVTGLGKIQE